MRDRIRQAEMVLRRSLARTVRSTPETVARAAELSAGYRSGAATPRLEDPATVEAYARTRMPATFAAATRAFGSAAERVPGFAPATHLDAGAGTLASAWAVRSVWPSVEQIQAVEVQPVVASLGRRLAAASGDGALGAATWRIGRAGDVTIRVRADLVTASYLLGELEVDELRPTIDALWAATGGMLVLVEPGSRAGYRRILLARDRLVAAGARVAAPCPGPEPCPVAGSRMTWCHFLARLDRSPEHRRAKSATRSWEDEPFSYVALARPGLPADPRPRVVLGRPRRHPGRVELRICHDGRIETRTVSRREGEAWRAAKDLDWGDALGGPPG